MRNMSAISGAALGAMLLGTALTAPAASASSNNYIEFTNNGWFTVTTCYKWKNSSTEDTCDKDKAINQKWKVDIPADATGADLEVNVHLNVSGRNLSQQITDVDSDHCYKFDGTTFNPSITEYDCLN